MKKPIAICYSRLRMRSLRPVCAKMHASRGYYDMICVYTDGDESLHVAIRWSASPAYDFKFVETTVTNVTVEPTTS